MTPHPARPPRTSTPEPCLPSRRSLLRGTAAAGAAWAAGGTGSAVAAGASGAARGRSLPEEAPNVVMVMLDDLGWGEIGAYGQKKIQTPHVDHLASVGVRFTTGYTNPLCAPTRASLYTGKDMSQSAVRNNGQAAVGFPRDVTYPEILQQAGYRTCLVGKWGFGGPKVGRCHPLTKGYDSFCGVLTHSEAHDYYPPYYYVDKRRVANRRRRFGNAVFMEHALRFIRSVRPGERFLLNVMLTTPHAPNVAPPGINTYAHRNWPSNEKHHAEQITWSDRQVGTLMDALRRAGLLGNTLVIFTGDNGAHHEGIDADFFDGSGPFRGYKRDVYEGGVRVPLVMRIPGSLTTPSSPAPGSTIDTPVAVWDYFATFAELAGQRTPRTQSVSFAPLLAGRPQRRRDHLYWEFVPEGSDTPSARALRFDSIKAVALKGRSLALYDLDRDLGERRDVAPFRPYQVRRARRLFARIDAARVAGRVIAPTPD